MSTIYVIFKKDITPETDCGMVLDEDKYTEYEDYIKVGNTRGFFYEFKGVLSHYIAEDTPIFGLDNCTELVTLKDLKNYYEK